MYRCEWVNLKNPRDVEYHDKEWGKPTHDDKKLFELLILEGAQAGLSWQIVLNKRADYYKAFYGFDPVKVAKMSDNQLENLLKDSNLIRNRRKIYSVRANAEIFLDIQKEFGSFDEFIWGFVDYKPIVDSYKSPKKESYKAEISKEISKILKKRGMSFVGPTIIYAYMQAIGIVNDHENECNFK